MKNSLIFKLGEVYILSVSEYIIVYFLQLLARYTSSWVSVFSNISGIYSFRIELTSHVLFVVHVFVTVF